MIENCMKDRSTDCCLALEDRQGMQLAQLSDRQVIALRCWPAGCCHSLRPTTIKAFQPPPSFMLANPLIADVQLAWQGYKMLPSYVVLQIQAASTAPAWPVDRLQWTYIRLFASYSAIPFCHPSKRVYCRSLCLVHHLNGCAPPADVASSA